VVCGPPGVGKSTLIAALVAKHPDVLTTCLPYLSREPAKGETNGEKFHFVKKEQFEAYQAQEGFFFSVAPAAEAGLMLGYSFESIRDASRKGKVTVVETEEADVAAALQTKVAAGLVDEVVCIFVQPDREEAIVERLKARAAADPKNVTATEEDCEALRKRCAAVTAAALTPTQGDALFAQHVLRNDTLEDCLTLLHDAVSQHHPTLVPPFVPPLVISGPYGSGKRTMCVRLLEEFADSSFGFAVNTTTRAPEEGEVDGEHFHFVTKQKFKEGIQAGLFLEWVDMEGVLHGMTWASVRAVQASGQMCIIDSDVESAAAMRDAGFKAVYLYFSLPPLHVLKERLAADGLEEKDVAKRVKAGKEETKLFEKHSHVFDLVLANEEEEVCYVKLKEHLHTISPSTVPISAVWGFGHPLWEPSLRKYAHRPLKVSILGAALSGKTTLSFMLSKRYDVPVISTGSLLRDAAYDNPTEIGIKAKEYLDGSKTVPDEFMVILAKKRIAQDDCVRKGYIFDGFPRTPAQVEMLTEANILLDKVRSARLAPLGLETTAGLRADADGMCPHPCCAVVYAGGVCGVHVRHALLTRAGAQAGPGHGHVVPRHSGAPHSGGEHGGHAQEGAEAHQGAADGSLRRQRGEHPESHRHLPQVAAAPQEAAHHLLHVRGRRPPQRAGVRRHRELLAR
jgi:guanylate kinase